MWCRHGHWYLSQPYHRPCNLRRRGLTKIICQPTADKYCGRPPDQKKAHRLFFPQGTFTPIFRLPTILCSESYRNPYGRDERTDGRARHVVRPTLLSFLSSLSSASRRCLPCCCSEPSLITWRLLPTSGEGGTGSRAARRWRPWRTKNPRVSMNSWIRSSAHYSPMP